MGQSTASQKKAAEGKPEAADQPTAEGNPADKATTEGDKPAGGDKPTETSAAAGRAAAPESTEPDNRGLTYAGENPQGDVSGPGTGATAPPESSYRMPSTIISDNEDNPLEPPSDHKRQADPAQGYNESSTDHVYAASGGRTIAGEDFSAFVDEDGNRLRASSLFDESDTVKTWVVAKTRAYEEFYYPNTTEKARRLVLVPGQKIPRAQAEMMKAAISDAPTPLAEV